MEAAAARICFAGAMRVAILAQSFSKAPAGSTRGAAVPLPHRQVKPKRPLCASPKAYGNFPRGRPDSSVVERGPEKAGVGGSIPSLATTLNTFVPRPGLPMPPVTLEMKVLAVYARTSPPHPLEHCGTPNSKPVCQWTHGSTEKPISCGDLRSYRANKVLPPNLPGPKLNLSKTEVLLKWKSPEVLRTAPTRANSCSMNSGDSRVSAS